MQIASIATSSEIVFVFQRVVRSRVQDKAIQDNSHPQWHGRWFSAQVINGVVYGVSCQFRLHRLFTYENFVIKLR